MRQAKLGFEKAFENAQELQANLDNDVRLMFETRQKEIDALFELSSEIVEDESENNEQELENYEEQQNY